MRKITFVRDGFYHVYNRGVDKRVTFMDKQDFFQFLQMLEYFNTEFSLGRLEDYKKPKMIEQIKRSSTSLVEILAYCINGNHYHLLLKQVAEDGVSRFMHKVATGYTKYFNQKNKRTGPLFSGRFKAKEIDTDHYLRHVGVYVNLNNRVHSNGKTKAKQRSSTSLSYVSSWNEYIGKSKLKLCNKSYLLDDFDSVDGYRKFALETLQYIKKNKELNKEMQDAFEN